MIKGQWSEIKIKDMFPDAPGQVAAKGVGATERTLSPDVVADTIVPPPLVYDQQVCDFNESSASSSNSVRLPRSMLREVAPPALPVQDSRSQETHSTPRDDVFDFVNNNAVSVNTNSDESDILISPSDPVSRMRAMSMLQNAPSGPKKFIPLSLVHEVGPAKDVNDRQIEISAAVSAAMGAALPYFRGQADLEYQMRLLLEKVTHLEESKRNNSILDNAREASAINFDRHLAELTEKRLQLLERLMETEQNLELNRKTEINSHELLNKQMHPVKYIHTQNHEKPKYATIHTDPRAALLSKSSSKSKVKKYQSNQKASNDSSILPRASAPKPVSPTADLLSEILKEHNDSSLHTINASLIDGIEGKAPDSSRIRGAESKILDELSRLREELYSLKYKQDNASRTEFLISDKSAIPLQANSPRVMPVFQDEPMPNLTKPESQLFDQYFREYSKISPFKHGDDNSMENLIDGPAQVLKEAEAFRRNIDFNDRVAAKNLQIREVHKRIDDLCRNIPDEYLKIKENVDFRIQRIRRDIETEVSGMNFEPPKPVKDQPKTKGGKMSQNQKSRVTLKESLTTKTYSQKPVASVKPNGHKAQTAAVRQANSRKPQVEAEAPITLSPAQIAYQNLILERQRHYLEKMEAMQNLPAGSSIQSAGLVYNKNFYPIKGKVLQATPETREAATETKFGVEKEIQTSEPPKPLKRVDFEAIVCKQPNTERKLAIETLPEVVIESHEKEPIPEKVASVESSIVEERSITDVIIAPGYRKPEEPPRVAVDDQEKNRAFSRVQACIEDEIVSNILRKIIAGQPTENVEQTAGDEESEESSLFAENELILQIFTDAGVNIDKKLVRKIGEEEVMRMILAIIEEQKQHKLKEDLGKCNIGMPRLPTPSRTPLDYSPIESEKESPISSPRPDPVKTQRVDRSISPMPPPSENIIDTSSGDEFMTHNLHNETIDHFIPTPQPNVETPERTPPIESPESSVADVSITIEVPPSPEKVVPEKIPEPAVPPVIEDPDCVDIGVQYEAPPSFTDRETSPIVFSRPEPIYESTESTSSSDYQSVHTPTTEEPMSDHEWVVPHEVLRSEGEFTPPPRVQFRKMPTAVVDTGDEADMVTRSSMSQLLSEGEVRPARATHWSEIRGPVTEALYEMKHLMAASNQKSSTVPKVERRRFKPYSSQTGNETAENVSGIEITGLVNQAHSRDDGVGAGSIGAEVSTISEVKGSGLAEGQENVRFVEPHPPDIERSSTGIRSARKHQSNEESNVESARTSSAYNLRLDALNTEESISDIEDVI